MDRGARGAALVSLGSLTLVIMAMLVKQVGSHIPTIEILFFRSFVGFFFVLPMFMRNPMEPLRTKRLGMHFVRGMIGTLGNICFFWTLTHMLLADAMALQFSRPLFMIPLALLFLGEIGGLAAHRHHVRRLRSASRSTPAVHGGLRSWRFRRRGRRADGRADRDLHQAAVDDRADAHHHVLLRHQQRVFRSSDDLAVGHAGLVRAGDAGADRVSRHFGPGPDHARLDTGRRHGAGAARLLRIVYSAVLGFLVLANCRVPWSFAGMAIIVASSLYLVLTERRR